MRSKDLTREQLERIERVVKGHRRYYERLWRRMQANDMAIADPLVAHVLKAAEHVDYLAKLLGRMKESTPRPYRPLVEPGKKSGLAWREMPWAEQQRRMMEGARREAERQKTSDGSAG